MPVYAFHHLPVGPKQAPRPKGARRIAMAARKASVADRRSMRRAR